MEIERNILKCQVLTYQTLIMTTKIDKAHSFLKKDFHTGFLQFYLLTRP